MGQKVNPISNRLGIIRGWDSNWYGGKNYGDSLLEDSKIRKYLNARLAKASVSRIVIERTLKLVTITVCTARPGIIIGKGGQEVDKLKEELKKITDKDIQINIFEVKRPELDAVIVANNIARQLLREFWLELIGSVVMVNTIGKPYAFEVFLEVEEFLACLVALVLGVEGFECATDTQVVATVLIVKDITTMQGCFGEVINEGLLLQTQ